MLRIVEGVSDIRRHNPRNSLRTSVTAITVLGLDCEPCHEGERARLMVRRRYSSAAEAM